MSISSYDRSSSNQIRLSTIAHSYRVFAAKIGQSTGGKVREGGKEVSRERRPLLKEETSFPKEDDFKDYSNGWRCCLHGPNTILPNVKR